MAQIEILVAEDDANIRTGLCDTLESEGYAVTAAADGKEAMARFVGGRFDLVLLDIMMPKKNGFDVCRDIRAEDKMVPIIMLTAKGEEIDKVVGLELGADDYITKPFGVHELLARISAVLRRAGRFEAKNSDENSREFQFGGYTINPKTFQMTGKGKQLYLSKRELDLVRHFYSSPGEVLSRDNILNVVWGMEYLGTTRTLDQHIARLRKKIEADASDPRIITTVHGVGYRYSPT